MRYSDEFSTFRSAIEWPDLQPDSEVPTEEFKPLSLCLAQAFETIAIAHTLAPKCESPIEIDFGARITKAFRVIDDETFLLVPQYVLGPFRYDFAIVGKGLPKPIALIECDGKEFHQTNEQLANDQSKNALAVKESIFLFRFSGSEIFRCPDECVRQVLKMMRLRAYLSQEQRDLMEGAGFRRH
jgi:hypothetical protein